MAGLDPRFICTSDIDTYYVDKLTGQAMSGGIVTFYSDTNRSVLKPVYTITGTPPNYSYAPLPDPCVLSSVGTFQDALGNNIVPYYYPFQGTPAENTGVQELYYITVVNSDFLPQLTREGWPNQAAGNGPTPGGSSGIKNYIPNGQFLAHNNIVSATEPPITVLPFGSTSIDSQAIAQGGWSFQRSHGGTSVFNNSFVRLGGAEAGLLDFPRYAFNFVCGTFNDSDQISDLVITWPDVNTFSSLVGPSPGTVQPFTFYFAAASNDSNTYQFDIYLTYYYGTGGSPSSPSQTLIGTVDVSPGYTTFTIDLASFPTPSGTLGLNDDDYVAIAIRGPATSWNTQFTDFVLALGDVTITSFPIQTNAEMLDEGVAGWMTTPNPNGQDLYLPLILTPQGMTFDHSQVGIIVGAMRNAVNNELYCDGSQYLTAGYSSLGIPYSRLQAVLFETAYGLPVFGTGQNFVNGYVSTGATTEIILSTNLTNSAQTNPADGSPATSFTFNAYHLNGGAGYGYNAYTNNLGRVTAISTFATGTHSGNNVGAGTSGMTVTSYGSGASTVSLYAFVVDALSASALSNGSSAGLYFTFSNHATDYYMWFSSGAETDPAPGGTGIKVIMNTSWSANDMGIIISNIISGFQYNTIDVTGLPTAGSNFTFRANGVAYTVWYSYSAATAPVTTNMLIPVVLTGSETDAQVASKTQAAINSTYFAVPDLRGMFLRGTDPFATWDLDQANRYSYSLQNSGSYGTFQLDQIISHTHGLGNTATGSAGSTGATGSGNVTGATGGVETRPVNATVNWFIKY